MKRRSKEEVCLEVSSHFCRCPGDMITVREYTYDTASFYRIWVPGMSLADYHDLCNARRYMMLGIHCRTKEGEHAGKILDSLYRASRIDVSRR